MTPAEYKSERQKRGTQAEVAALLGLDRGTIIRRENGMIPITVEAAVTIRALPLRDSSRAQKSSQPLDESGRSNDA